MRLLKLKSFNKPKQTNQISFKPGIKAAVIDLYNARSWNPETHPEGIGDSKWVQAVHWDQDSGLLVKFRDGFKAVYDVDEETAKKLVSADSKGRFVWKYLYDKPYKEYKGSLI